MTRLNVFRWIQSLGSGFDRDLLLREDNVDR